MGGTTTSDVFGYDLAGRLAGVTRNGAPLSGYTYDENGNRLTKTGVTGVESGSYDAQDRLVTYGGTSYGYSANGELQSKTTAAGSTNYIYDEIGNLTRVTLPDGRVIEYVIDGQNRRIGRKVNGTLVQRWLYGDPLRIVAETDGSGTVTSRFVYATRSNSPDLILRAGAAYRIASDHLGSPRLVVDTATGSIVERMDYGEFGNVTGDTNPGFQPFGFAGGLYDPDTKLVRFGARDYDPQVGRWAAKDPIGFAGSSANLYGYVFSDPVNWVDPTGLEVLVGQHPGFVNAALNPLQHTAIVLRPDNPADFVNHPLFSGTAGRQATLGGQAFGRGRGLFGRLRGAPNYPDDDPRRLSDLTRVSCPTGISDTDFINRFLDAAARYRDDARYDPFPDPLGLTFNSNSYVSGLIRAAGGMPPNLPRLQPGYGQPLPFP